MRRALFAAITSLWNAHPWLRENAGKLTWGKGQARQPQGEDDAGIQTRYVWTVRQADGGSTDYETGAAVVETINLEIEGYCVDADKADLFSCTIEEWIDAQEITTPQPYRTLNFWRPGPGMVDETDVGLWNVSVPVTARIARQRRVKTT